MVFETSTATFIPVWVAQDCRLRSFKYCLWHQFFWPTLPCKLCRMRRSFKPICRVHNFVNHGQLIWMLQMGALSQFLQHQEKPTVHRGDFLPKLGKEAILLIWETTSQGTLFSFKSSVNKYTFLDVCSRISLHV